MKRMRTSLVVIAFVSAALSTSVFPALAQARTRTGIVITSNSSAAKIYTKLTLGAQLKSRTGRLLANRPLRLESRPSTGTVWSSMTILRTSAQGRVSWKIQPREATVYRFRYAGSTKYHASKSPEKKITGHGFVVEFNESFSGSKLDTATWTPSMMWGNRTTGGFHSPTATGTFFPSHHEIYSPDALSVADGHLTITASIASSSIDASGPYTSGAISTSGKAPGPDQYRFTYGYIETRLKIPRGKAMWPAVWTASFETSPTFSEIDIFEGLGQFPKRNMMVLHQSALTTPQAEVDYNGDDLSAGYHTFAVDWTPDHVIWYRDGIQRAEATKTKLKAIPNAPMYLIACMQVGGWNPTLIPDATTPKQATFAIDYIRVYKHK